MSSRYVFGTGKPRMACVLACLGANTMTQGCGLALIELVLWQVHHQVNLLECLK